MKVHHIEFKFTDTVEAVSVYIKNVTVEFPNLLQTKVPQFSLGILLTLPPFFQEWQL